MMIKCDYCRLEKETGKAYKTNFCDDCVLDKEIGVNKPVDTIVIRGYGVVSKARVAELERRVMLPYDKPGGGYYVGRRMENGKINENKVPDYRP